MIQKQLAAAQVAEIRGPRTRRSTQRPDYVYHHGEDEVGWIYSDFRFASDTKFYQDEDEDFVDDEYQDHMDDEADFINDDPLSDEEDDDGGYGRSRRPRRAAAIAGTERRRSTRTAVTNANGSRGSHSEWRGERRSSRLGAPVDQLLDLPPPAKCSRTSASATPSLHEDSMDVDPNPEPPKPAALRPNEVALPSVPGKKKSKFWFYAVEPAPGTPVVPVEESAIAGPSGLNGGGGEPSNGSPYGGGSLVERRGSEYSSQSGSYV